MDHTIQSEDGSMILVTGATGKVGSEAVRLLRQQGLPVRAMVRDRRKAAPLAAAGAELAEADFDDPGSIGAALAGVETVILVSPGVPTQELNVVAGAAGQGAKYVIKVTSNASLYSPIARRRAQAEIEAGLAASGLAHTLLRANAFLQNTLALAPAIKRTGGFGSSAGHGQVGMVDARDVSAVAAAIAAAGRPRRPDLPADRSRADHLRRRGHRAVTGAGPAGRLSPGQLRAGPCGDDPGRGP
jgi:uncharacterized protein YbjT (DUF2867 family)